VTPTEAIERARAAIGEPQPDDKSIAPSVHADALPAEASALAAVLRGAEATAEAAVYETSSQEAAEAQRKLKKTSMRAAWAVFVTGLSGAALLFAATLTVQEHGRFRTGFLVFFGVVSLFSGVLAGWQTRLAREQQYLERWMRKRAAAEAHRLSYFQVIAGAHAAADAAKDDAAKDAAGVPLTLLALEYVRRYQLAAQHRFYTESAQRHKKEADRNVTLGSVAVVVGALSAGLAALLAGLVKPSLASLAALGVVGSGLSAVAAAREGVSQSRLNAERYEQARDALVALTGRLDKVRRAVATGNNDALKLLVDAIHEVLAGEHKQWLAEAQKASGALEALEKSLAGFQTQSSQASQAIKPASPPPAKAP
jgi:hypothetical protein